MDSTAAEEAASKPAQQEEAAVVGRIALDAVVEAGDGVGVAFEDPREGAVAVDENASDVVSLVELAWLPEKLEQFFFREENAGGADVDQLAEGKSRVGVYSSFWAMDLAWRNWRR